MVEPIMICTCIIHSPIATYVYSLPYSLLFCIYILVAFSVFTILNNIDVM